MFYLVGAKDSRKPGQMAYLDDFGKSQVWPFSPDTSDEQAQWRFVRSVPSVVDGTTEEQGTSGTHYFIASGPESRYANEMLYNTDVGPAVDTWELNTADAQATWKLLAAPPETSPSWDAAAQEHLVTVYVVPLCVFVGCCALGLLGNATKARRTRNLRNAHLVRQASSNRFNAAVARIHNPGRPASQLTCGVSASAAAPTAVTAPVVATGTPVMVQGIAMAPAAVAGSALVVQAGAAPPGLVVVNAINVQTA